MNKQNNMNNKKHKGGGGENAQVDYQQLTQQDIEGLMKQGVMPEQIAALATEQGQPVPPIIQQMLSSNLNSVSEPSMRNAPIPKNSSNTNSTTSKALESDTFPAMMGLPEYSQYSNVIKKEQNNRTKVGANTNNGNGYAFSDLISEKNLRNMKRTQGSFLVGVNINNLFNEFTSISKQLNNTGNGKNNKTKKNNSMKANVFIDSETIFKKIGEYVNVDFDNILDKKMGFRGSATPLLPELTLTNNSTFYDVVKESVKYADTGYGSNITPFGLLIMTRMLYKYRKNNSQWIRVATILELIYKYFGDDQTREDFFKNRDDISILSLIELEEFYNTDHIFMSEDELISFKKDLSFYKYDSKIDIKKKIHELMSKTPPPI